MNLQERPHLIAGASPPHRDPLHADIVALVEALARVQEERDHARSCGEEAIIQ